MRSDSDRILALAGVFQACDLVDQIGRSGQCAPEAMRTTLFSLLQVDADSVPAVYGGLAPIESGLQVLKRELTAKVTRNPRVTQYAIQLLHLENKLSKSPERLSLIAKGIEEVDARQEHFTFHHPNSIARFADIYANSISTLAPRVMVKGETVHLNNPDNVNLIRALLLAGIRSAMLWRQCGGKRWQIIFGRNKILRTVNALLKDL